MFDSVAKAFQDSPGFMPDIKRSKRTTFFLEKGG